MSERFNTIQFRWPFGRTVFFSSLCVLVLLVSFECLFRINWVRNQLPVPMIGSGKASFDITYERLCRLRSTGQPIDVLFVGTSMIKSAINPEDFARRTGELAGMEIHAFNLSMNSLDVDDMPLVFQLIHEEIRPRVIVMEVSPLMDHAIIFNGAESWKLSNSPWGRYRMKKWNLRGWMADQFLLYRYALRFHNWVSDPEQDAGFSRKTRVIQEHGEQARQWRYSFESDDRVRGNIRRALKRGIRESQPSLKFWRFLDTSCPVVLLEVPFRRGALPFEGLTADSIVRTRESLQAHSAVAGLPMVDCADLPSLPLDHWANMNHLNPNGATVYTLWASERLEKWIVPILESSN